MAQVWTPGHSALVVLLVPLIIFLAAVLYVAVLFGEWLVLGLAILLVTTIVIAIPLVLRRRSEAHRGG